MLWRPLCVPALPQEGFKLQIRRVYARAPQEDGGGSHVALRVPMFPKAQGTLPGSVAAVRLGSTSTRLKTLAT